MTNDLQTIATSIAQHMDGYSVKPVEDGDRNWWATLVCSDPAKPGFVLNNSHERGKIRIRTDYKDSLRYDEDLPSINVSATKDPQQIAKDIARRLMPGAIEFHIEHLRKVQADIDFNAGKEKFAQAIAEAMNTTIYKPEWRGKGGDVEIHTGKVRVRISGPESARFDISGLSAGDTLALAKALSGLNLKY
jgi:hypothetical protein